MDGGLENMALKPAAVPSGSTWPTAWFDAAAHSEMVAWRGVESQTEIATLHLVDTREEHEALEALLEASKPPKPEGSEQLHYLLFTPFRYTSPTPSRFRRAGEGGVWYGADTVEATCAEIAYWRHRFILASAGLVKEASELVTAHTIFSAKVTGRSIDLLSPPWSDQNGIWTNPHDYTGTQALAAESRAVGIEWIRYGSVRHPGGVCAAALSASALANTKPDNKQEWLCRATRQRVLFYYRDGGVNFSWDF
jgi:RES domain